MSIFSVVFQDFRLFSFSLGQNVAANVRYDRDNVLACLEKAGFRERLDSMPNHIETCLYKDFETDGVEISSGEAQKIALARALYKDCPFMILDEPTAALDPVSEYEVYCKFNEIAGGKRQSISATAWRPAVFAIKSLFSMKEQLSKWEHMRSFLQIIAANTMNSGTHRHSIMCNKNFHIKMAGNTSRLR